MHISLSPVPSTMVLSKVFCQVQAFPMLFPFSVPYPFPFPVPLPFPRPFPRLFPFPYIRDMIGS
ncbi:MAG: hypothetical protein IT372_41725 [Polyangiaceae bacterium]|nr:hypothetical protein [Polyangiaceae bacterium]